MSQLPIPDDEALEQSAQLVQLIINEIDAQGGWISFASYMELALYHPEYGYYSAGLEKFGRSGDFITAPELSTLFGRALASQAAEVLRETAGNILELGAGSGKLAVDLLIELERLNALPGRYYILELSAHLRFRQNEYIAMHAPHLFGRVCWLDRLPEAFEGLMLANEVIDAMPVHVVGWTGSGILERGVARQSGNLAWAAKALSSDTLQQAINRYGMEAPYVSEVNLAARASIRSLGSVLRRGVLLLLDYGFGEAEYYHPQRNRGTLMCHYRHHAHDDPFYLPGLQDITAHVDFSALAYVGLESGLTLAGYTTQANFLINCGIVSLLEQVPGDQVAEYLPLANQVQKLLAPHEMGELFKAMALAKNLDAQLRGFKNGDKRQLL